MKSKNNDKNKNKSANVSNKSQSATNDRLVKSAIPAPKTLSPLAKPRKEGSSPTISFLNNSIPTMINDINIPQILSLPYKPLFSSESAVIQDLIKLNQELVNRVQVLEKELELSKRKFSDVSDKNPDVVVEGAPVLTLPSPRLSLIGFNLLHFLTSPASLLRQAPPRSPWETPPSALVKTVIQDSW